MKKIVAVVLIALLVGAGSWYVAKKVIHHSEPLLSEDTVSQMIEQKYGGTVKEINIIEEDDQENYKLTILKEQIYYDVTVNGQTGEVLSFKKENEETEEPPSTHEEPTDSDTSSPNTPITKEQAKKIALSKVSGTITGVDLDHEDGQLVYEIDIDQTKTKEATVVINAYTGEIEAITFETDEND
ncbi:PepSY domain-containing protein [Pseudobacillus wudalianchiensis]|uniref:PepSY domain-containing protein n=1 Tax=Pseudobacillus wudalianchiensis TaxID=1743143 RepID=A0A1B9B9W5_9BACI|nr:PepSY domain-containing protein [Bacillus wudalianchiensis]OCA92874.1 hypothetical protein A8F95_04095 [Bacillus wudalianchiensis]